MNIKEIRAKYPQYSDISDGALVEALHKKYYSDIPYGQFEQKVFNTTPAKIGAEGLPDAIKEVSGDFSGLSKGAIGAAGAVNRAAMRLKQLTGKDLTKEDIQGLAEYKALQDASGSAVAGDIGMSILATLNPATKLYNAGKAVAAKVLPKVLPKVLAPAVGAATSGVAITAATTPTEEGETSLGNAATGAAGSVIADTATRGMARVAQPVIQSAPVQKLLKEGVVPTIGQSVGGWLNRVEQAFESVPIVGAFITHGRGRAVKDLNEAAIRKALPNESDEVIKAGRAGIERADEIIDGAYDRAYGQLKGVYGGDKPFQNAIKDIPTKEGIDLPPSLKERFDQLIQDRVYARLDKGANAETVRDIHNSLGTLARKYRASGDADQRSLGQAFAAAKDEFRASVSRQTPDGGFKTAMDALDDKYTRILALKKASGYDGANDGIFSASQLKRASKKADPEFRAFTQESKDVLGPTLPNSGSADRMLWALGGASAAGGTNEYLGGPGWLTGLAAAPLLYSRPGAKYAVGALPLQKIISDALRSSAPFASQAGREAGNRY